MNRYAILTVPDDLLAVANATGAALGRGENNYGSALPETNLWYSGTWVGVDFCSMILAARAGMLPPVDWAAHGITAGDVLALIQGAAILTAETPVPEDWNRLVISAPGSLLDPEGVPFGNPGDHFSAVLQLIET